MSAGVQFKKAVRAGSEYAFTPPRKHADVPGMLRIALHMSPPVAVSTMPTVSCGTLALCQPSDRRMWGSGLAHSACDEELGDFGSDLFESWGRKAHVEM